MERTGKFWWLNDDSTKISGTFSFTKRKGALLSLYGLLPLEGEQHPFDRFKLKKSNLQNIYGESHPQYEHICLINPFHWNQNFDFSCTENSTETYKAFSYAISKKPFDIEGNVISSISWPLKNFEKWLYLFSGQVKYIRNEKESIPEVTFEPMPLKKWDISLGNLYLKRHWSCPNPIPSSSILIEEQYYLTLDFSEKKGINYCIELSRRIFRFFLTFVSSDVCISNPEIKTGNNSCIKLNIDQPKIKEPKKGFVKFVTFFKDIESEFGELFQSYINLYDTYLSGFYLYPSSLIRGIFVEQQFSNIVCGLEALHTHRYGKNPDIDEEKLSHIKDELRKATSLNSRDRQKIIDSIKYNMKPNLKKRLLDLFHEIYDDYNEKKLNDFLDDVIESRNTIMHYGGPRSTDDPYSVQRIQLLSLSLTPIYVCSVLRIVGIKKEFIKNIFLKSPALYEGRSLLEQYGVLKK